MRSQMGPLEIIKTILGKVVMSRVSLGQVQSESFELSQYEDEQPQPMKDACSTKYSRSIKSKLLLHQDNQSVSYSSTLKAPSSNLRRKQQNKQSAKKCRMRKKERCLELEQREKQLLEELSILQAENAKAKLELEKEQSGSNVPNVFNNIGRAESYDRLSKIIQSEDIVDEDEINLILDNLRHRVGATGIQRQGKINYIFKQIIHISFPALHRYFMWTADKGTDCFGAQGTSREWMDRLDSVLNLTESQKEIIRGKKDNFQKQYQTFSQLINEMKSTKSELEKESAKLEELIENLRYMLTPIQCAKLIIFIEDYKYKQEMDLWVKRNMRKFSEQITPPADDPGPQKRPKLDEL